MTLWLFNASTRQIKKISRTDSPICTRFRFLRASSSVSLPVSSKSMQKLVVMAVKAESELLKAAAMIPIVNRISTPSPR